MKPGYGLQLIQSQRLSLTPELRQAITILQLNAADLLSLIQSEVQENPLLEMLDEWPEEPLPEQSEPAGDDERPLPEMYGPLALPGVKQGPRAGDYERYSETPVSLRSHLLSQLGLIPLSKKEYCACEHVIGSIDDNGYLLSTDSEMADLTGYPVELIAKAVGIVRSLEPVGVGARSLRECLDIQAHYRRISPLAHDIIEGHLEDLAAGRYRKIARKFGVEVDQVLWARDEVQSLDPKPGAQFSETKVVNVIPDVIAHAQDGEIKVTLNEPALPEVRWSSFYLRLLRSGDPETREYLKERQRRARALLSSIEGRRDTVLRVMTCVARHQEAFFKVGPLGLKPLTLRQVASELSMHESTVSRSVSQKYILTPHGTFPCKGFFSPRLRSGKEGASQGAAMERLREVIQAEDPKSPLSDSELAEALSAQGFEVARRTVAKYRACLGIAAASRRRRP